MNIASGMLAPVVNGGMYPQLLGQPRLLLDNMALSFKLAHGAHCIYGSVMMEHHMVDGWPSTFCDVEHSKPELWTSKGNAGILKPTT